MTGRRVVVAAVLVSLLAVAGWWSLRADGGSDGADRATPTTGDVVAPDTTTTTTTVTAGCDVDAVLAQWPLEVRLAQLLMVGVDPGSGADAQDFVSRHGVGGIFVGGDATGIFTDGSLGELASADPIPPLVAVDEEGGRVQRIDAIAGPIPSARQMAQTMTPDEVRSLAFERGQALRELGVTMDFAPVVDVSDQAAGAVIGDRSFGNDADTVIAYARAFAQGLAEAGVVPVLKHFPGHGHATGDSHLQAAVTPPLDELRESDLLPYRFLLDEIPGVMVGHLDVPGLTQPGEPASVSPDATTTLLRGELGHDGFVITDDLSGMAAITDRFTVVEAVVRAIEAGADMALLVDPSDLPPALDRLEEAVRSGVLDETAINRSVQRVLALKSLDPCTLPAPGSPGS